MYFGDNWGNLIINHILDDQCKERIVFSFSLNTVIQLHWLFFFSSITHWANVLDIGSKTTVRFLPELNNSLSLLDNLHSPHPKYLLLIAHTEMHLQFSFNYHNLGKSPLMCFHYYSSQQKPQGCISTLVQWSQAVSVV